MKPSPIVLLVLAHCGGSSEPPVAGDPVPPGIPPVAKLLDAMTVDAPPAWRSCLLDGTSPCISPVPVRVVDELVAWSNWIREYSSKHPDVTECRWVSEIDQVLLCGSSEVEPMNDALLRPSMFVEHFPRVVVKRTHPLYRQLVKRVGGYDLLKDHPDRPDLLDYYKAVDAACPKDAALCPTAGETAMRALLERAWVNKPSFVVISFAASGAIPDDATVSHEILHAQYFSDPKFRAVIDDYWKTMPSAARAEIKKTLGEHYNRNDDYLLRNEFQAFVLMSSPGRGALRWLVQPHRDELVKRLWAAGAPPIAVEERPPPTWD